MTGTTYHEVPSERYIVSASAIVMLLCPSITLATLYNLNIEVENGVLHFYGALSEAIFRLDMQSASQ